MNAKEYLNKLIRFKDKITKMQELADYFEHKMQSPSGGSICVIGNDSSASHESNNIKYLCKLDEQNRKIDKAKEEYKKLEIEIISLVNKLEDERQKEIILMRYVEQNSWDEINSLLYISRAQIFREHNRALEELDVLLAS